MNNDDTTKHDISGKTLEILLHGLDNPNNASISCPYAEWMGDDLVHVPGVGEWKCKLQKYYYASDQYGIDSSDYGPCMIKDHTACNLYK